MKINVLLDRSCHPTWNLVSGPDLWCPHLSCDHVFAASEQKKIVPADKKYSISKVLVEEGVHHRWILDAFWLWSPFFFTPFLFELNGNILICIFIILYFAPIMWVNNNHDVAAVCWWCRSNKLGFSSAFYLKLYCFLQRCVFPTLFCVNKIPSRDK